MRQLQYSFIKAYEDFEDLTNPDSLIYKILTTHTFFDQESEELNIESLLLFGLLHCQGSTKMKSVVFYDIL